MATELICKNVRLRYQLVYNCLLAKLQSKWGRNLRNRFLKEKLGAMEDGSGVSYNVTMQDVELRLVRIA